MQQGAIMKRLEGLAAGFALGAVLMFYLDPASGRRRRHQALDRVAHGRHELSDARQAAATRVRHKAQGLVARTRARFASQQVDDSVLEARVRAHMGHAISHAGAIHVEAEDGVVTITGPVLVSEANDLLERVSSVPGVHEVHSRLTVRRTFPGQQDGSGDGRG
jgi:hyperosmotically inducible protein